MVGSLLQWRVTTTHLPILPVVGNHSCFWLHIRLINCVYWVIVFIWNLFHFSNRELAKWINYAYKFLLTGLEQNSQYQATYYLGKGNFHTFRICVIGTPKVCWHVRNLLDIYQEILIYRFARIRLSVSGVIPRYEAICLSDARWKIVGCVLNRVS